MQVDVVTIKNRLPGMGGRLVAGVDDILIKGGLDIITTATPLTPIDKGPLRANVIADKTGVYWGQFYAPFQEFGTVRGVTPKLFATTAASVVFPQMIEACHQLESRLI